MTWDAKEVAVLREEFVLKAINKVATFSELCHQYQISRKTGYKWLNRYESEGILGLNDRSKEPTKVLLTDEESVNLILQARRQFPSWGARKLRQYLINQGHGVPSESTFNRTLKRHNQISKEESSKRQHYIRFERGSSNELWQMDFKGHFQVGKARCHPLTVLDDHSRYSICLKACERETEQAVKEALTEAFQKHGLPEAMTMDNGSPWKGSYPWRFSSLVIWLMKLGIQVSHSRPYHPQTQGKDERFHRTLKEEVLKYYQFNSLEEAQVVFEDWRHIYNNVRPHEGIGLKCPKDRYVPSSRVFPEKLPDVIYSEEYEVRKVQRNGAIEFKGTPYFVGEHFFGEYVGIKPSHKTDGLYNIFYCKSRVKTINLRVKK